AKLALSLFDQTQSLHELGDREKEWLEYAAILHDVGYLINQKAHHKHTYYLIKNSDLAGLAADEIEMIANVARYHRGPAPGRRHVPYRELPESEQRTLKVLGAILRVADGLDRSHFEVVQKVNVVIGDSITIEVHCAGDSAFEIWTAKSRLKLLEKVMKRKVRFVVSEDARLVRAQAKAMFTKMLNWATRSSG
ncbi:MAG: HD domain-containing protein, partial [Nitrospirota bacterium]|nr:HD domain-containing protein [Nitrospirota bacterium]